LCYDDCNETGNAPYTEDTKMKTTTTIKRESTNEANVSDRIITFCVYSNGILVETFTDIIDAMEYAETI